MDDYSYTHLINVSTFRLGNVTDLISDGSFTEFDGEEVPCRFYLTPYTEANLTLGRRSASMSERVRNPNLVSPVIVETTLDSEYVAIGFTDIEPFVKEKLPPAYSTTDVLLNEWWQTNAKDVLKVLADSHSKSVYHGSTDNVDNYIIRSDRLCLILPHVDSSVPNFDHLKHREADIKGLGSFLKNNVICAAHVQLDDWDSFIDLFSQPCCWEPNGINHLINHPVLKSSEKRFHYLRDWLDTCYFDWNRNPVDIQKFWAVYEKAIPQKLFPFHQAIKPGTIYEKIYMHEALNGHSKYGTKEKMLLEYLLNVLKYASAVSKSGGKKSLTTSAIERDLSTMYPGLLASLHFICATSDVGSYVCFSRDGVFS